MFQKVRKYQNYDKVLFTQAAKTDDVDTSQFEPDLTPIPLNTSTTKLSKGTICKEGHRPLVCDLIYDQDVPVKLRDGVTVYVDVFRPDNDKKHPVILAYTPYGKIDPPNNYDLYANRAWMEKDKTSGLDTFESPDPDYWVSNDYVLVVADSRGSTNSEGALLYFGNEEGLDAKDVIEWAGEQNWSNGNVGMAGNSWLAAVQYFTAAVKPSHLKAIAPWEGFSDIYRDVCARGGIPSPEFFKGLTTTLRAGEDGVEDICAMVEEHPLYDDYWDKEKRAAFENIEIPGYFTASYSSNIHPYGTFRAFNRVSSKEKWLRVHNSQEWPDQYTPKYRDDLRNFFDHYLKGLDNGWENTPKVRVSVLEETGPDTVDRPEEAFPIPRTQYKKLYLNGENISLSNENNEEMAAVTYEVGENSDGKVEFRLKFNVDTEYTGYFKAHLFVSTDKGNDMDIFTFVSKEDSIGVPYQRKILGCPFTGSSGRLRVSQREIDYDKSEVYDTWYKNTKEELIKPNEVVEVEIAMWPLGMRWRKGETLLFTISAGNLQLFEFPVPPTVTRNQGQHTIYTGGKYASYLEVPEV